MSTTPIKRRILNVLVQHKESAYLTVEQIAEYAYGDAYIRDTKKHLNGIVRRNIYSAMEMAIDNNMIILPVKRKNHETGEIEKRTLGYKIAGKEDGDYINMLLQDKEKRANAYILAYNSTVEELKHRNLLPESANAQQFLMLGN